MDEPYVLSSDADTLTPATFLLTRNTFSIGDHLVCEETDGCTVEIIRRSNPFPGQLGRLAPGVLLEHRTARLRWPNGWRLAVLWGSGKSSDNWHHFGEEPGFIEEPARVELHARHADHRFDAAHAGFATVAQTLTLITAMPSWEGSDLGLARDRWCRLFDYDPSDLF